MKGCGTEHFLVDFWQRVLENLEDPRAVSIVTSIGYCKAFTRLDWNACIATLKNKGTSVVFMRVISNFLSGRKMVVKLGDILSTPRQVRGGVPPGSLLGILLFNLTMDNFEQSSDNVEEYGTVGGNTE